MRYLSLCSLLLLLATSTSAQVVQLTEDPSISYLPEEIAIEASAQSDGFPAVVAWGSTAEKEGNQYRHVLYAQGVRESGPIGEPNIITGEESHPIDLVRVIPLYNMYLVLWNDARSDAPGLYGQYVDVGGVPIADVPERFGQGRVSRLTTVPNNDGTRLILWNEGDRGEGRLLRLDRNGNRLGLVEGIGAGVVRVVNFRYGEYDRFILQTDGNALPLSPDGSFDFAERVAPGRVENIRQVDEDGGLWLRRDSIFVHYATLWSENPDDTLDLRELDLPVTTLVSGLTDTSYTLHRPEFVLTSVISEEYRYLDSNWALVLRGETFDRESRQLVGSDSTKVGGRSTGFYHSGSTGSSWSSELTHTGYYKSTCPGGDRVRFAFESVRHVQYQSVTRETYYSFWGVDPYTSAIVTTPLQSCDAEDGGGELPLRVDDPGFSTLHYREFPTHFVLRAPTAEVAIHRSTERLGLYRSENGLTLLYDEVEPGRSRDGKDPGPEIYLASVTWGAEPGLDGRTLHRSFDMRPHTRSFPTSPRTHFYEMQYLSHYRVGPVSLVFRRSERYDSFEPTGSADWPYYHAYSFGLAVGYGRSLIRIKDRFEGYSDYKIDNPDYQYITQRAWEPDREEAVVIGTRRDTTWVAGIDRLGRVQWDFKPASGVGRNTQIIPLDSGRFIAANGTTLQLVTAVGTEPLGSFTSELDQAGYLALHHNRFLRYGYESAGGLILETYDPDLTLLASQRVGTSRLADLRVLLADDHGDSALVLLSTEGSQIVVRTMNQSLEGLVTERFDAVPDQTWTITDLYGAFLNDTLVVAFVGRDPQSGDNEIYAHGLPVPDVPEERGISGVGGGIIVSAFCDLPTADVLFHLSPNPVSGELRVSYRDVQDPEARLRVADILGRVILEQGLDSSEEWRATSVDLEGLPPGTYIVAISDRGRESAKMVLVR